jgi:sulfatase modifying factor 1
MVSLPGGTFIMGDRKDKVTVQPFSLDVTEVTAEAYAACVKAGGCTPGASITPATSGSCVGTYGVRGEGTQPITCVDWSQAKAYCKWAQKRLPTEEEWEWAARGQSRGSAYPWGDDAPGDRACWAGEGADLKNAKRHSTCPVGAFPAGDAPGGIHDLAGNACEWTASKYDDRYVVVRGGAFGDSNPSGLRAAWRDRNFPSEIDADLGFRCAR